MSPIVLDPAGNRCPICGSDLLQQFSATASDSDINIAVSVIECLFCLFAWQYPVGRSACDSDRYFTDRYAEDGDHRPAYFDRDLKTAIAACELGFVQELGVAPGTLLDIGAGAGIFANVAAEAGWRVTAVDPVWTPGEAPTHSGVRSIRGILEDVPDGETFDIVTLWDVIEHVENPVPVVSQAKERLKHSGWLVLETGNHACVNRVFGDREHWIYKLNYRWYFTPESLRVLLLSAGFTNSVFARKMLRPVSAAANHRNPHLLRMLGRIVTDPFAAVEHLRRYNSLRRYRDRQLPDVGIFAVASSVE